MNKLALGAVALLLVLLCAAIAWQERTLTRQKRLIEHQTRELAEVTVANAGLALALGQVTAARARDNELVAAHANARDRAQAAAAGLEQQLREALSHARTFDLDAPLPFDVVEPLCLRWHAASGTFSRPGQGDTAQSAPARTPHSPAGQCEPWRMVTLRQALEWTGRLLDHAGAERLDKSALREWAGAIENSATGQSPPL